MSTNYYGNSVGAQNAFQSGFMGAQGGFGGQSMYGNGGYGYSSGMQDGFAVGVPGGYQGAVSGPQAIFQPMFAGTDVQRVRNQIAQDGGFGYGGMQGGMQSGFQGGMMGDGMSGAGFSQMGLPAGGGFGAQLGPQAIFQPGFAGTDAQRVRNQIARDGGFGYGGMMGGLQGGFGGYQQGFSGQQMQSRGGY